MIEQCTTVGHAGWLPMRTALWPDSSASEHLSEMELFCTRPDRFAQFIAYDESRQAIGMIEVALRSDYVNGTSSSPVAFLEGIYVIPAARGRGIARNLVACVEQWAVLAGCSELASDAQLDNGPSHAMHRALGFSETERVVYFRKPLQDNVT
ncbi:MAG: aminoglycoside 6'-N-acetyltransferase [Casimicrobiaceae bacterium]